MQSARTMSSTSKRVENDAMQLSPEERAELADKLWLSLEPAGDVGAAWTREIERRIRELESGEVEPIAHKDVIAELRARYGG
jgi:putative addiction module component (TIGR02574 family)